MIVVVIEVTQGQRRVTVQYAKRIVGRKMYGGHSTHIPLKVNQAGVIPIIFASSVLMFPITIAQFVQNETVQWIASFFAWGTVTNTVMYALLIMFFTYFYTAISLNIPQLTENMQKYGGFIPGIRPGQPTAMYIDRIMTRITLPVPSSWPSSPSCRTSSAGSRGSKGFTSAVRPSSSSSVLPSTR